MPLIAVEHPVATRRHFAQEYKDQADERGEDCAVAGVEAGRIALSLS
ncbi:hypothetical protein I6A81_21400 [Frankia sp. CN7]|nr:hypothetical protein [Frankia nepalensis]